ncbi:membrane-anchored mycosin MYCP [Nocardioides sp. YR527]|uniref:S8/S53 family peptidase n=1 Tax=Nocardioides sp. YR527 TaxID=1881028 RepID=UPI000881970B|nr:S8/S53 family peptidase [Nocardioides sp. YR527]SDK02712.1 membrane-anchored mycosin MYCP [Nocardioides sp. YR527]
MRALGVTPLRGGIALVAVLGGLTFLGGPSPAYAAEERPLCTAYEKNLGGGAPQKAETQTAPVPETVAPFAIMRIAEAQKVSKQGQGIRIAVVDSGYSAKAQDYHGTVAAGLISEIAPKAKLSDHPVLKVGQEKSTIDAKQMVAQLNSLAKGNAKGLIVDIGLPATEAASGLDTAVDTLIKKGAIVVTAADWSGVATATDRDMGPKVFPNANESVVTVSASGTGASDPESAVLPNSNTDVAAPTYGAPSKTLFGQPCWVDSISTSFASAEVSAVLALIWSTNRGWSAEQVIDRLYGTTSGREGQGGRYWGAGVVNAYDALTRPAVEEAAKPPEVEQAPMAREKVDPLATVRENAIWWAIAGGGALGLGLVLRPLLSRRKGSM